LVKLNVIFAITISEEIKVFVKHFDKDRYIESNENLILKLDMICEGFGNFETQEIFPLTNRKKKYCEYLGIQYI
jgi:hypothetical protein